MTSDQSVFLILAFCSALWILNVDARVRSRRFSHRLVGKTAQQFEQQAKKDFGPLGVRSSAYKNLVRRCSDAKGSRQGQVLYFDTTPFILNEPELCSGKVYLIVAIHSYPPYRNRRDVIRETWGSVRQIGDKRIKLVFFVGKIDSKSLQMELQDESRKYRDIVQRNFVESYRNMTRKHLTVMEWVSKYCSKAEYVMKTDDDTFTDIFHAINLLSVLNVPGFYCTATVGAVPQRKNVGHMKKWRVTRAEYPDRKYPAYCEGLGYIMKTSVAKRLYWCSVFSRFFWIDDVYVGGVLPQKLGIPRTRFWRGHGTDAMRPSHAAGSVVDYIFLMAANNEFMKPLWTRLWKTVVINGLNM